MALTPWLLLVCALPLPACGVYDRPEATPKDTGGPETGTVDSGNLHTADTNADSDTGGADPGPDTAAPGDLDGDGYDTATDCDDTRADVHPGAAKLCDWVDHDCDGELDCDEAAAWAAVTQPFRSPAEQLQSAGDLDGDGVDEIQVGYSDGWRGRFAAVFSLASLPTGSSTTASWLEGDAYLIPIGDVDGDGHADLSIRSYDGYTDFDDSWFIWFSDGILDGSNLGEADCELEVVGDEFGWPAGLWGGGVDGDGLLDLIHSGAEDCAYFVGVVSGSELTNPGVAVDIDTLTALGHCPWAYAVGAAKAGDADGDGLGDIVLTCRPDHDGTRQVVALVSGPLTATSFTDADAWWRLEVSDEEYIVSPLPAAGGVGGSAVLFVSYAKSADATSGDMTGPTHHTVFTNLSDAGTFAPTDASWVARADIWATHSLFVPDVTGDGATDLMLWNPYYRPMTIWSGAEFLP